MIWSKDGREILDNDDHKYVVYSDGGIALRLSNVRPQDAGEYTCLVRNNFGEASSNGLFIVQGIFSLRKNRYSYLQSLKFKDILKGLS